MPPSLAAGPSDPGPVFVSDLSSPRQNCVRQVPAARISSGIRTRQYLLSSSESVNCFTKLILEHANPGTNSKTGASLGRQPACAAQIAVPIGGDNARL